MKKITLLFAFLAAVAFVNAQKILMESFDLPAGNLVGQNGWLQTGTSATTPIQVTASTSMTYPGYETSAIGNEVSLTSAGQDANKPFVHAVTSGAIYYSALVNFSAVQATGDYFMHISDSPTGTVFFARLFAKLEGGKVAIGILNASGTGGVATYLPTTYDLNTTYLVVIKYEFANNTASVIVNPALETEPTTGWLANATGPTTAPVAGFSTFGLRQGNVANAPTVKVDAIRVATSWVALFDDSFLTSFSATKSTKLEAIVSGKNLLLSQVSNGSQVEIFSALGSKVQTSVVENGKVSIANLKAGVYVVRAGKLTQKIKL